MCTLHCRIVHAHIHTFFARKFESGNWQVMVKWSQKTFSLWKLHFSFWIWKHLTPTIFPMDTKFYQEVFSKHRVNTNVLLYREVSVERSVYHSYIFWNVVVHVFCTHQRITYTINYFSWWKCCFSINVPLLVSMYCLFYHTFCGLSSANVYLSEAKKYGHWECKSL